MVQGIPFLGENNFEKKQSILNRKIDRYENISVYKLFYNINKKENLIVIDNKYLTWLDDTIFNYRDKKCYIQYFSYETFKTNLNVHIKYKPDNHLDYDNESKILIRHNFSLNKLYINLGIKLNVYNINTDMLTEYTLDKWIDEDFDINKIYDLYLDYCYYDANTNFSCHDSGYTYISKRFEGIYNKDRELRYKFMLDTWHNKFILQEKDYRDTRIYKYFTYIDKIKNTDIIISDKEFRYRRLNFEVYLYCCLRSQKRPINIDNKWDKLGKSLSYVKIEHRKIPMFIKCEWLDNNELEVNTTWRH